MESYVLAVGGWALVHNVQLHRCCPYVFTVDSLRELHDITSAILVALVISLVCFYFDASGKENSHASHVCSSTVFRENSLDFGMHSWFTLKIR